MIQKVTLPEIGRAYEALTIERWLKREGDTVAPGDILCEIMIDKALLEIESSHAGTLLAILTPPGVRTAAGAVVAALGDPGEAVPAAWLTEAADARAAGAERSALDTPAEVAGDLLSLTPMRRIIADRMLFSKQTIPCYYLEMDCDVTDLVALRGKVSDKAAGVKITFNDFLVKACGMALKAFPVVNSRWVEGRGIERRRQVNVGFAVALNEGLLVPVVSDVDLKTLREVSRESADLIDRARIRKLRPEELTGGCMSITNLGIYGIKSFIPITNPGESTILGVGMINDRVVARGGEIVIRKIMNLTLAVDHRMIDGAIGAQFFEMLRNLLEDPKRIAD
jgi:pyruvate dehydrogenase E2 component (dihydrolipoamide acetyltransferase)